MFDKVRIKCKRIDFTSIIFRTINLCPRMLVNSSVFKIIRDFTSNDAEVEDGRDISCRRGDAAGVGRGLVDAVGWCVGPRHGPAVPQPVRSGGRHIAPQLTRLGHRHLPLLARPRLRHRRPRTRHRRQQHRPDGSRVLVRRAVDVRVGRRAVAAGGRNAPEAESGALRCNAVVGRR